LEPICTVKRRVLSITDWPIHVKANCDAHNNDELSYKTRQNSPRLKNFSLIYTIYYKKNLYTYLLTVEQLVGIVWIITKQPQIQALTSQRTGGYCFRSRPHAGK